MKKVTRLYKARRFTVPTATPPFPAQSGTPTVGEILLDLNNDRIFWLAHNIGSCPALGRTNQIWGASLYDIPNSATLLQENFPAMDGYDYEQYDIVRLDLADYGALDLGGTTAFALGDIPAGSGGEFIFTGQIVAGDNGGELVASLSDARLGAYDWIWTHHRVDTTAPDAPIIQAPTVAVRPDAEFTVFGVVTDTSPVPTIELEVTAKPANTTSTINCTNPTSNSSGWACQWFVGASVGVTSYDIRAQATDAHGNVTPFGAVMTYDFGS